MWWEEVDFGYILEASFAAQLCPALCNLMDCSMPGFPVLHHLLEFAQTYVYWVGDAIQPSHPLLPSSPPPSIFPRIRVFSNEWALHIRWPDYWSFSFSICLSNEYSGLISFRTGLIPVSNSTASTLSSTRRLSLTWKTFRQVNINSKKIKKRGQEGKVCLHQDRFL